MKVDIVLQGPVYPYTPDIIKHYQSLSFVNNIIVSCWTSDDVSCFSDRVLLVRSHQAYIKKPGGGNVNYQIQTSRAGIKQSSADIVFKIRTDQQFHLEDMERLVPFLIDKGSIPQRKLEGSYSIGKIIVGSIFTEFPYHPRDHLYLGYREDMLSLFDAPFSDQDYLIPDTIKGIRPEAYLGVHYCAKFDDRSERHAVEPHRYLTDQAPDKEEALRTFEEIRDNIFLSSPKIRHIWKKHGVHNYTTLWSPTFKEHWSDSW